MNNKIYCLLPLSNALVGFNDGEKAAYTNLPEGDYTFEVKSIYPDEGMERWLARYIFCHTGVVHCLSDYLFSGYYNSGLVWLFG